MSGEQPGNPVELHFVVLEEVEPALFLGYQALLSADERARGEGFVRTTDRRLFLVARALVRTLLSQRIGVPPEQLRFKVDAFGRPRLSEPNDSLLQFNLSHTDGLVACALSDGCAVGVDVESLDRESPWLELAVRFFSPTEVRDLQQVSARLLPQRFLRYWTAKEAVLKASGTGLSTPLDSFTVDPLLDEFQVVLESALGAPRFHVVHLQPTPKHELALALGVNQCPPTRLRMVRTVPLKSEVETAWLPLSTLGPGA